ncbi:sensor histidine kinase [Leptolyngbya sp. Heron Island J]|uniref:sensor histidine kinase n=1 Tax=Leptolyngbya sp. Heron Island J TaxID=1385935 RepID=UPI00041965FC|nr:PAS domain-containing sensor histidine kinase [Leptolyngbya sp. Heron Island J]
MTAVMAVLIEASRQAGSILPIPFMLLLLAAVLSASIGGIRAGLSSSVIWASYVIYAATVPFGPPTLTGGPGQVSLGILVMLLVVLRQGITSDRNRQLNQKLKALNETLESQVRDRTAKLSAVNAQLQQEIQERYQIEAALRKTEKQFRNEDGAPLLSQGTVQDITEHQRIAVERSKVNQVQCELTFLEQILENILAGYWNWDIPNHQEYLSPGFKRMFGYEDHELPNSPDTWQKLIFSEDLPKVLECFEQHVHSHGKVPYYNEVRYRHKDGSTVWIICSGQVIAWDQAGNPLRMIGCHVDISDLKHAEDQVKRYMAKLEISNQELEAFSYSVSHDLRAPLRAIHGYSQVLLEDYGNALDQVGRNYFERICINVNQMRDLIDNLLNLSRVSRAEMCCTTVNLSAIAQEVMAELCMSEPERSVDCSIAPAVMIYADPDLIKIVLANLLQNAWKFTSHHPIAHIEFGIISPNEQTIYFIRDDGAGFNSAYSKMLFGVFQRLHAHHEFPGTGIGLATVQRIIHRHGGKIWAEGAVEQGATFYFTIPRRPSELSA